MRPLRGLRGDGICVFVTGEDTEAKVVAREEDTAGRKAVARAVGCSPMTRSLIRSASTATNVETKSCITRGVGGVAVYRTYSLLPAMSRLTWQSHREGVICEE